MATNGNTVEHFKKFLEEYSKKENADEDSQPLVPQSHLLTEDEVKGEILDCCINRLDKDHCPDFLKFSIANDVASTIITKGLEEFKSDKNFEEEEPKLTYYSASSLCKAALLCLHEVCMKWSKQLPSFKIPSLNSYSVYGIKNTRRKMEDKHTVITDLNTLLDLKDIPRTEYYAVFDGHGGLDASSYSSKQLHVRLAEHDLFKTDVQTALKDTIRKLDEDYCKKSQRDKLRSGTTAVVCVIREETLYIAWIGDSQAALVRNGEPVTLMDPHKPEKPAEKSRIEELGGCVIWFGAWRVNGTLSVSRAIGDADFKPFVCGDADSSEFKFVGTEDYLCIACDGFWDVFNGAQLVKLVSEYIKDGGSKESLSQTLCTKAKEAGSSDNITVLVVFLRDDITIKEEPANGEKAVINDVNDGNQQSEENSDLKNGKDMEENVILEPPIIHTGQNVMVHGNKLQPTFKERPPHKLYVNKPNNVISKVSVIVTDSTPHAKLPHSVVTHKSPWQSQVSPKMERRDTRGSLISQSTYESDEITTPLSLWTSEHRSSMINNYSTDGLPVIVNRKDGQISPHRNSPSPSCISEPVTSVVIKPTRPQAQRQSRGRQPYRTSIVINNFQMDNGNGTNGLRQKKLIRRSSLSVPRHLNLTNKSQYFSRPLEFRSHGNIPGWNQNGVRNNQSRYSKTRNGFHKENVTPLELNNNNAVDTEIAITNSLYNKIKPKRSNNAWEKPISKGRNSTTIPILLLYRRQRSRSAM